MDGEINIEFYESNGITMMHISSEDYSDSDYEISSLEEIGENLNDYIKKNGYVLD